MIKMILAVELAMMILVISVQKKILNDSENKPDKNNNIEEKQVNFLTSNNVFKG